MRSNCLLALFVLVATAANAQVGFGRQEKSPTITTEGSKLAVSGGNIWYRVLGGGPATPLILLHGGPGVSSIYLKPMEALADERLVVRYDQLGAGKSDAAQDTALFTIDHFVAELDSLRSHLGLEKVHLYGHSWGATLALEYYRAHPGHVASLVLASGVFDVPAFDRNMVRLMGTLPDSQARAMLRKDAGQPYDTLAYQAAAQEFNRRHSMRKPIPADLDTFVRSMNATISDYMLGTSVTNPGGTLKDYDARPFLKQVRVPVLFVVGEDDFVGPELVKEYARLTPGARLVVIPASGHMTPWDNTQANNDAVRSFLHEVDTRARR